MAILAGVVSLLTAGASQPSQPHSNFGSRTPQVGAPEVTHPPLQLVVHLTDGSRVIGETPLTRLPLRSAALGRVVIPLAKIRTVKFSADHESAAVALQNGDKVQGHLGAVALTLQTLFGRVTVPLELTTEIEVRRDGGRLVAWDILPFPEDSNWPGPRGEPALIQNNNILLQGRPVRTQTSYTLPLTIECEVELEERAATDGAAWFDVVDEQDSRNLDPKRCVMFTFGYAHPASRFNTGELSVWRCDGNSHGPMVWGKTPFPVAAGQTYQLRWDIRADGMTMTIDGQTFDIPDVTVPWEKVQVRLMGWQPANRWHVRNLTIH